MMDLKSFRPDVNCQSKPKQKVFRQIGSNRRKKKLPHLMGECKSLKVSSEIYTETNFHSAKNHDGMTISQFSFVYPSSEHRSENYDKNREAKPLIIDEDGDLIVERKRTATIKIAHQDSTELALVGLQVWRGALLLADFLLHNRWNFADKCILELGSGCGLTSIAASVFSETEVICTDIDLGGILNVIKSNVQLNKDLKNPRACIKVMELDFKKSMLWSSELKEALRQAKIIIAADVIYDNDITDHLIETLQYILDPNDSNQSKDKQVFLALEKRYVFTLADLDTLAPCYEYFLQRINELRKTTINWKLDAVDTDFPQYFNYERSKELIIMKLYV